MVIVATAYIESAVKDALGEEQTAIRTGLAKERQRRTYLEASSVTVDDRGIDEEPPDLWRRREKLRVCEKRLWNINIRLFPLWRSRLVRFIEKIWLGWAISHEYKMHALSFSSQCATSSCLFATIHSPIFGTLSLSVRHMEVFVTSTGWNLRYAWRSSLLVRPSRQTFLRFVAPAYNGGNGQSIVINVREDFRSFDLNRWQCQHRDPCAVFTSPVFSYLCPCGGNFIVALLAHGA